jgi:ABC-type phosphate/phosphonate transport system substrate-binding protein
MFKIKLLLLLLLVCNSVYSFSGSVYTVGVRAFNGTEAANKQWSATVRYLDETYHNYIFNLKPIVGFDEMETLFKNGELDFVITQAFEAVMLRDLYGGKIFLSLLNSYNGRAVANFSSVLFVKGSREDINSVYDFKGKTVAAINPKGFGGYLIGLKEIRDHGLKEFKDFDVVFKGTQNNTVVSVMTGEADVGIVRTGVIENLINNGKLSENDIKIINRQEGSFPFIHSTRLYPEWGIISNKNVDNTAVADVQKALIDISSSENFYKKNNYSGWIRPVSYQPVYDIMKELEVGLYKTDKRINQDLIVISVVLSILLMLLTYFYFKRKMKDRIENT